jgi:hypothetical protein
VFGLCVLNRVFGLLFVFIVAIPGVAFAQAQKGTVIADEAQVYKDADFDAPVMATLHQGEIYSISTSKKGPFFKIRLKPGVTGWIADSEIRPGAIKLKDAKADENAEQSEEANERSRKPFFATRYRGISVDMINFTEDTMGGERNAQTMFYGLKFNGYNTLFSGDIYTESNLIFHVGAPSYYGDYTGEAGSGFVFLADFLFQTVLPRSPNFLFYYGFGPMFKYSHFDLKLPGVADAYTADDMTLGVIFDLGVAFRMDRVTLRPDVKYYWEKSSYLGFGLGIGLDF